MTFKISKMMQDQTQDELIEHNNPDEGGPRHNIGQGLVVFCRRWVGIWLSCLSCFGDKFCFEFVDEEEDNSCQEEEEQTEQPPRQYF